MWSIRVLSGPQAGQIFELKSGKNTFGRGGNSDFKISSLGISKEHCEVQVYKDKVVVLDLKSSNGTFVNGVKIQNSIIKLGDKLSLFDVIMDVIPKPEVITRPAQRPAVQLPPVPLTMPSQLQSQNYNQIITPQVPQFGFPQTSQAPETGNGNLAVQMYDMSQDQGRQSQHFGMQNQSHLQSDLSLKDKIENYIENGVMPAIYKLAVIFPFKHVLMGFVLVFILSVTLLSIFPLTTILRESNLIEASKRAKSVARTVAKVNESALLAGQFNNLSVQDALKEEGIKEALIIQHSDGAIVAPTEKAGRESSKPFIITARKEGRSTFARIDSKTIGASYPIGAYDPVTGETGIKYHAIVYYDVSSLNVDDERIISLFMQTLAIAGVMGFILYFLFGRLIEYPLKQLNQQIDTALRDKSDRTEVLFDYPEIQKVVANVNLMLNRMWNGLGDNESAKPKQNRDVEFSQMVQMLHQPALVMTASGTITACNSGFEEIAQMSSDQLIQQNYLDMIDPALVQNLTDLMSRSKSSPYEKQQDRIPFPQFECDIYLQSFLDESGQPEYYFVTLHKNETTE